MALSDFEISKIAEIVAGKSGAKLDAKALRQVIDRVVDQLNEQRGNPDIEGATCEVSRPSDEERAKREEVASPPREGGNPSSSVIARSAAEGGTTRQSHASSLPPPDEASTETYGGLYEQIEKSDKTRVIVATFGKDRPGVAAALTQVLAECNCSIEDISQTLLQDFFSMIMIVNIDDSTVDFSGLRERLQQTETQLGMKVYVMHEDIFRYMHRI